MQASLEDALLQIETLMAEKEEHKQELDEKNAKIKKQETLVLKLNQEIIDQDTAIFGLQRRNREKDAALMEKDGIIAELDTKAKRNKQHRAELRAKVKERDSSIAALNYTLYANLLKGEKLERENKLLREKIKQRPGRSLRSMVIGSLGNFRASQALAPTSQAPNHSPTGQPTSTPSGQMEPQEPARTALDNCSITRVERGCAHHPRLEVEPRLRDSGIRGWLGGVVAGPAQRMFRDSYEDLVDVSRAGE